MFSNLKISNFRFCLQAIDRILLPEFKGSAFRGGFGHSFKKVVCTFKNKTDCLSCMLKEKCLYSYIFETITQSKINLLKKSHKFPHPFIIESENNKKRIYEPGENFGFDLILIGRAIEYVPYFIYSFKLMGNSGIGKGRGTYFLKKVFSTDFNGNSRLVYDGIKQVLTNKYFVVSGDKLMENGSINTEKISLDFITPTRIKYERKLIDRPEFHILMRNVFRRLSLLMYRHCDIVLNFNHKKLIEEAEKVEIHNSELKWFDWERYSNRQKTRMKMGGFIGKITYKGELVPFIQFLKIGEYIHIGKNVSFGLGKYKIVN